MARQPNTNVRGEPFDEQTIQAVWQKGKPEPGYASFRADICGAAMQYRRYGMPERWGWEIDHIKPVAHGGTDDLDNLQPLHWENNRHKADNYPNWDCKLRS